MTNPLREIVAGRYRRIAYVILASVGTTLAGLTAGYAAISQAVPDWLLFSSAFFGVITGPAWTVPASNVRT